MEDGLSQQQFTFNSLQVVVAGADGDSLHGGELMATSVGTSYVMCPAIMTEVCIEDVWMIRFECDTAA